MIFLDLEDEGLVFCQDSCVNTCTEQALGSQRQAFKSLYYLFLE